MEISNQSSSSSSKRPKGKKTKKNAKKNKQTKQSRRPFSNFRWREKVRHWNGNIGESVTEFYWVLLGFTGFYRVLQGFTEFYRVLQGFTGFYWVLLGFIAFHWIKPMLTLTWSQINKVQPYFSGLNWILSFTAFYRNWLSWTDFYRVS